MNTIYDVLSKFYETVRNNLFYILLSLLVPIILWKVKIGEDLIFDLLDLSNYRYLNAPILIGAFVMISLINWVIPVLAIDVWRIVLNKRLKSEVLYKSLIKLYNGEIGGGKKNRQFPIRYFACLPWFIFLFVLVKSLFADSLISILFIGLLFCGIMILDRISKRGNAPLWFQKPWDFLNRQSFSEKKKAILYVFGMATLFLLFLFIILGVGLFFGEPRMNWIIAISHLLSILLVYAYMRFSENLKIESDRVAYLISKYTYSLYIFVTILLLIVLQYSNSKAWPVHIGFFSPIIVLIVAVCFYLLLADLFITAQLNITRIYNDRPEKYDVPEIVESKSVSSWYVPFIYLLAVMFAFTFFFKSINSHRIRKEVVKPQDYYGANSRPMLSDYFDAWVERRFQETKSHSIKVFLISGQGGGSRAAAWMYMAMKHMSEKDTLFSKNLFSISTVSGSTSGAAMYLADQYLNVPFSSNEIVPKMKTIYSRNYLSSAFWGMFIGDGYEGFKYELFKNFNYNQSQPKDRNYYFQNEEVDAYTEATRLKSIGSVDSFFYKDYLKAYISNLKVSNKVDLYNFPLFFINSAVVETGERGVFSPVLLDDFSFAVDLYGLFKQHVKHNGSTYVNIPLIACVNQSQAFPLMNAYNYVDHTGRLMDGGIYENSGTTTTLEIYETLKKHIQSKDIFDRSKYDSIKFVCINIVNTDMEKEQTTIPFRASSILNTFTAAFQSPFGGHENFSYKNILKKVSIQPDTAFSLSLKIEVPLTRMLTKNSIDEMFHTLQDSIKSKQEFFNVSKTAP